MRAAAALLGVLIGVVLGTIGAFLQAQRFSLEGSSTSIPWGAIVAGLGTVIVLRGAAVAARTRWAGCGVLTGWILATLAFTVESPSGDIAIASGTRQGAYLLATVVAGSLVAVLPVRRRNPKA